MSDSAPRRSVGPHFALVNYETGEEVTPHQKAHLSAIAEAAEVLRDAMHAADGSTPPGEHQQHTWSGERMKAAAHYIELGVMLARKAALEA
jgi:hypothetical protein